MSTRENHETKEQEMIFFTDTVARATDLQGYNDEQIAFIRSVADRCRDLAEVKADYAAVLDALA